MNKEDQERLFNRELSWLEFNARVLAEAQDEENPLLERLKFAGIVASNMDEFFMVRIASLTDSDPEYMEIYRRSFALMDQLNRLCEMTLFPKMESEKIIRSARQMLGEKQLAHLKRVFEREIYPFLTPIALREHQALPMIANLSLYRAFTLGESQKPGACHTAIIEIPKNLPRVITLPSEEGFAFILLEDVLSLFSGDIFKGFHVIDQGLFRVTRAAVMTIDEENDEDFSRVMTEALRAKRQNAIVRLEVAASAPIAEYLQTAFELPAYKVYAKSEWIDLKSIAQLAFQPAFGHLRRPERDPKLIAELSHPEDIWDELKERDILIIHPYESFDAFIRFLNQAAEDPDVLAIKQTLYRAGDHSLVVAALEKAAGKGKQVTVLIEIKARFDEERNIEWAKRLERAGVSILYGIAGLKTHSKACLVVRREPEGIKRYLHLSTGNYNEKTAKIYSDISFFTSQEALTSDIQSFFNVITGFSQPVGFYKIDMAPFSLRKRLKGLIDREIVRVSSGQKGLIMAKMNSLADPEIIDELYKASSAGVKVKLNVRGICCLKPGVQSMSENVEVVSIVDMFLEHARIFYFYNGGGEEIFLSSADWMPRNFDRRIEIMFPVEDPKLRSNLSELLELYFKDNVKSWKLCPDGHYEKVKANAEEFRAQQHLLELAEKNARLSVSRARIELKPQRPNT